jgi:hypothetical protein
MGEGGVKTDGPGSGHWTRVPPLPTYSLSTRREMGSKA